mmetsp:Transcript_879/g.2045  ORF Transcript_879/g.2045 Transcript_879/m.2045 type:complete len:277 (-) Transcript_879:211-1041(-)|eukprot:CAMPEP_0171491832 /NCGR_PEP_ID=MMETSP0958-20121227/4075_1 /TAXON_ID=87120 /ORGANISM="Aurantiochytrium limacinum, Strain ATCCMYA-1381" /LENGTH=276 /DNA_ID=CAMNT_0012025287 /DNA_START=237 /DNA_END=1067 /DNA_ORIENTATION=-
MGSCSQYFLYFMNSLVLLVGLGVLAIGIFLAVTFNGDQSNVFGDDYPKWANYVAIAIGAVIAIIAAVGFCITKAENRIMLGITGTLQLLFAIVLIVAGAFILVYTGYLEDIRDTPVLELGSGIGDSKHYLYDYIVGIYETCCDTLSPAIEQCNSVDTSLAAIDQYCYFDSDSFQSGQDMDNSACTAFQDGGELAWCPTSDTTSGSGLKEFQTEAAQYFRDYIWPAAVALVVLGGVLFLACIASYHLACKKHSDANYEHVPESTSRPQYDEKGMTMA